MTNTAALAGKDSPDDTCARQARLRQAARRPVNISNGDFVFAVGELRRKDGLTAPRGVNLIGKGPDVLRRVDMLGADYQLSDGIWTCGKDGQSVPVNVGTPTVRIASITVGGTEA